MGKKKAKEFTRREREIMDVIYRRGEATAKEVLADLKDPSSYSSVRTLLSLLEKKGHLTHRIEQLRYIYRPTMGVERARKSALKGVLRTFFDNSVEQSIAAILDASSKKLTEEELERISKLIDEAKKEAKRK